MFELDRDTEVDDKFFDGIYEDEKEDFGKIHLNVCNTPLIGEKNKYNTVNNEFNKSSTSYYNRDQQDFTKPYNGSQHIALQEHHGNIKNKHKVHTPLAASKSKRERMFPGPAGLLPDQNLSRNSSLKLDTLLEPENCSNSVPEELCSQEKWSVSGVEQNPWNIFLSDLGEDKSILDIVNVASVKRKATSKCFVGRKVPFLAGILHHIDISSPDPCIILWDMTSKIHGTLHREVWELYAGELVLGSVLVIRNVGLLSTGLSYRRHYLNITANNIVTIYSVTTDKLKKTMLQSLTTQDYSQTIQYWRTLNPTNGAGSSISIGSPKLLNSMSSPSPGKAFGSSVNNMHDISSSHIKSKVNKRLINHNLGSLTIFKKIQDVKSLNPPISSQNLSCPKIPPALVEHDNIVMNFTDPSNKLTFNNANINSNSISKGISCQVRRDSNSNNNNCPLIFPRNNLNTNKTNCSTPLSPQIVLSPSTLMTAEEQSLVDSIFDGINADILFSEDF